MEGLCSSGFLLSAGFKGSRTRVVTPKPLPGTSLLGPQKGPYYYKVLGSVMQAFTTFESFVGFGLQGAGHLVPPRFRKPPASGTHTQRTQDPLN